MGRDGDGVIMKRRVGLSRATDQTTSTTILRARSLTFSERGGRQHYVKPAENILK